MITGAIEEQNAAMLYALLANDGGISLPRNCFKELPLYLNSNIIPILVAMPPHHYWEKPPKVGILPEYGPDFGTFMIAEVLSTKSLIYVKDQDGLYSDNPEKNPKADFIPKIHIQELIDRDLKDLPLERSVLKNMAKSNSVKKITLINGLKKGQLTKALNGEEVGTVIYK
jgi:molybdenum storage protein